MASIRHLTTEGGNVCRVVERADGFESCWLTPKALADVADLARDARVRSGVPQIGEVFDHHLDVWQVACGRRHATLKRAARAGVVPGGRVIVVPLGELLAE
jgi:hypothetical protein